MEIDNDRDRFVHGFDAGQIVDGVVSVIDGSLIIVDDDGVGYDVSHTLQTLAGQRVRLTVITMEAIDNIGKMLQEGIKK